MAKKKVTLEEAKKLLGTEKIFLNGDDKFNFLDFGKFGSGFTIVIPQEWNLNSDGKPESPISSKSVKELTDGMNIDFDGEATVLFGIYRLSKTGKNVFELTNPKNAKDVFIDVNWGGAFNKARGQDKYAAEEAKAKAYVKKTSNGGGLGVDYWVLPVNYVKDMPDRDVSEILDKVEADENERVARNEEIYKDNEEKKNESLANKDRILEEIQPIIDEIKQYNENYEVSFKDYTISYLSKENYHKEKRYLDEVVSEIKEVLEQEKEFKKSREKFLPQFQNLEKILNELGAKFEIERGEIKIRGGGKYFNYDRYKYNDEGLNSFVEKLSSAKEQFEEDKIKREKEIEELKKKEAQEKLENDSKEKGYPSNFTFWNRLTGATGNSHAFVIRKDGTIRQPDENELRNKNHEYKYSDWLNFADGNQKYKQICEGEIVVSYTKENSSTPYVINLEWSDGTLTNEQIEIIKEKLSFDEASSIVGENNKKVDSIEEWISKSVSEKTPKFREQLNIKENNDREQLEKEVEEKDNNIQKQLDEYKALINKLKEAGAIDKEIMEEIESIEKRNVNKGD